MPSSSTHLTVLLLVDALRPDYVARAPGLQRLAGSSATGALREGFGFVPRAAYFGGLDAGQFGFTNMYCFDPAHSPFGLARALPASRAGAVRERQIGLRQLVEASARERVAPFAQAYASTIDIPLPYLPYFDLAEKRAPWDRQVGYPSLFALLEEHGLPWYQCSWPDTTRLADPGDEGIVRQALRDLRPDHRFAYVHLQELDGIGHVHGPNSAVLQNALTATDRRCQHFIETLRARYDHLDVVLFGDHGMVNVTRTLDVEEVLRATGLKFGIDYGYFLDSTMARFWFLHAPARARLEQALAGLAGGRLLQERDLRHYGIAGCDSRNAELIFLAEPGVLIFPNFFQSQGEPIKGMHGYDPDCPDNLGFFLLHCSGDRNQPGAALGKVDPPALFPLLLDLIGLPARGQARALVAVSPATRPGRFTIHPDPAADEAVRAQLATITDAIVARVGRPEAIVLTGSFGRGEGGVFRDRDGRYRAVNDFDLLVIDPRDLNGPLQQLGHELAGQLEIDFVDLSSSNGRWAGLPLTIFNYDLRYGSQVLLGDPSILERLPPYASADLPPYEAVKLLLNRSAGLLTGLRGSLLAGTPSSPEEKRYLTNQIAKALMALGDWHLVRWQGYDSSYRVRRQRLQSLAPGAGLSPALTSRIAQAYEFKCQPDYAQFAEGLREITLFWPDLETALLHSINLLTEQHAGTLACAMTNYLRTMSADSNRAAADNAWCMVNPEVAEWLKPAMPRESLRHLVYSALPFVLQAAADPDGASAAFAEAFRRLEPCFRLPTSRDFDPAAWELLRARVVKAWFALCH